MKTYVWSVPTRIFHWLLAIGFAIAYISGETEAIPNFHHGFGLFVGSLLVFRFLFGLIGPVYSRFRDFPMGVSNQINFIKSFFNKQRIFIGHNPGAAVVMLGIILIGISCSFFGFMIYAIENQMITSSLGEDFFEEGHEILAGLFLILVFMHLLGTILDSIFHSKTGTLASIFTGNKNEEGTNVQLNVFQKFFSVLWIVVPLLMFFYGINLKIDNSEKAKQEKHNNEDCHEDEDGD